MPPMPDLKKMSRTEYVMLVVAVILTMCIIAGTCGYCGSTRRATPMPEVKARGYPDDEPMVEVEEDKRIKVIVDEENDTACYVQPEPKDGISCVKLWRYFESEQKEGDL